MEYLIHFNSRNPMAWVFALSLGRIWEWWWWIGHLGDGKRCFWKSCQCGWTSLCWGNFLSLLLNKYVASYCWCPIGSFQGPKIWKTYIMFEKILMNDSDEKSSQEERIRSIYRRFLETPHQCKQKIPLPNRTKELEPKFLNILIHPSVGSNCWRICRVGKLS